MVYGRRLVQVRKVLVRYGSGKGSLRAFPYYEYRTGITTGRLVDYMIERGPAILRTPHLSIDCQRKIIINIWSLGVLPIFFYNTCYSEPIELNVSRMVRYDYSMYVPKDAVLAAPISTKHAPALKTLLVPYGSNRQWK